MAHYDGKFLLYFVKMNDVSNFTSSTFSSLSRILDTYDISYDMQVDDVLHTLNTRLDGLNDNEVTER